MTYRIVCPVNNNQVIVTLPPDFVNKKEVVIVVDDQVDTKAKKLELLKHAAKDPLFLADVKDIHDDFDTIDQETI